MNLRKNNPKVSRKHVRTTNKKGKGNEDLYSRLFENNKNWVIEKTKNDPDFFERTAKSQNPDYLYIGCSDSRVNPYEIMGVNPSDLFIHRNVANQVVNTDMNAQAVIQFAVEELKVKHIILCGHYGCGGVKAAMEPKDMGLLNGWLREIRDVYRSHKDELKVIKSEKRRYDRLVELNVQEQCVKVLKTSWVEKSFYETGYPIVHGCVYDLASGRLRDLDVNFEAILSDIKEIYDLEVHGGEPPVNN